MTPTSLGDGIHLIPVPLPFESPPSVNVFALEGQDGLTLLDCGVAWDRGHQALVEGLRHLGLEPGQAHTLVVTHLHPDHVGLAPRLTRELGLRLVMHERVKAVLERYNGSGLAGSTGDLAARHGAPPETVAELARPEPRHPFIPFADPPDVEVSDGDRLDLGDGRFLEVLHTPGHEQAHICLRDSRTGILFSGDHVLPGITPVVMYDEMVADALGEYISSLTRIRDLGAGATYPAHGTLMQHGSARAAQIILHHQRRLAVMSEEVRIDPKTAWAVMSKVFRPHLNMWEQRLALRETIAHLEHLRLNRRLGWSEQQGVVWYRRDAANPAVMAP